VNTIFTCHNADKTVDRAQIKEGIEANMDKVRVISGDGKTGN